MKKILFYLFFSLFSLLPACTTMPSSEPAPFNQMISWTTRQQKLNSIKNWHLQGAMAVNSSQQSETVYIDWQQNHNTYQLHLFGPLGIASSTIIGKPGQVILYTSDQKTITAHSPEELIQKELGWLLPISNLRYWIRGFPVPKQSSKIQFDSYHHLVYLEQQGWKIQYLSYAGIKFTDLPNKMVLTYPNLHLRIIINQWTVR